jgi:hypothetical protein
MSNSRSLEAMTNEYDAANMGIAEAIFFLVNCHKVAVTEYRYFFNVAVTKKNLF